MSDKRTCGAPSGGVAQAASSTAGQVMPEAVIWIASYPKSGNTWVQTVIRRAGRPFGFPQRDLDVYKLIAEKRKPVPVGGIRPEVSTTATTVLKTHSRYVAEGWLHPRLRLHTAGFVYIMRNPLDVLLSYINFTRLQYEKRRDSVEYQRALFIDLLGFPQVIPYDEWLRHRLEDIPRGRLDHALKRFTELGTAIPGVKMTGGSWLQHCFSWLDAARALPCVVLRYEDLLKGPEHFLPLRRMFEFSDAQIRSAVADVSRRHHERPHQHIFFNKMGSYYYKEFFSRAAIHAFVSRFERELDRLGYGNLEAV